MTSARRGTFPHSALAASVWLGDGLFLVVRQFAPDLRRQIAEAERALVALVNECPSHQILQLPHVS